MQKFGLFKLNTGVSLTNNTPAQPLPTFQIKFNLNTTPSSILKDEKKLIVNKDLMSNPSINSRAGGFTLRNPTSMPSTTDGKIPQISFPGYTPTTAVSQQDLTPKPGFVQKSLSKDVDDQPRSLFDYPQNAKLLKANDESAVPQQSGFKFGVSSQGGQGLKWQPPSFSTNPNLFKTGNDGPKIPVFSSVSLFSQAKPPASLSPEKNLAKPEDS